MSADQPPRSAKFSPVPIMAARGATNGASSDENQIFGDNHYVEIANKHWRNAPPASKLQPKALKTEIWDALDKENFNYGSLLILENLQIVEKYLWPGFSNAASNYHVLLLAILVNVKKREGLPAWSFCQEQPDEFAFFFRRALSMTLDRSLPLKIRTLLISFVVGAFQSLDNGMVRKECAPLVSISIWQNLHSESFRAARLADAQVLKRAWKASTRRFDGADEETKARLSFDRSWLYTLAVEFLDKIYEPSGERRGETQAFCERLLELFIDLLSQLPTRRYVNALFRDLHVQAAVRLSPMISNDDEGLFRSLFELFQHYSTFAVDDNTGQELNEREQLSVHHRALARLQKVATKQLGEKLKILALSNFGSLENRSDLESHLQELDLEDLVMLCSALDLRTSYPPTATSIAQNRLFFTEVIVSNHEKRPSFRESIRDLAVLPTEKLLHDENLLRTTAYNGSRPLAIPKLNLQYLTMGDFLWRAFTLHRYEAFHELRKHVEDVLKRMQPRANGQETRFDGFSRLGIPIAKVPILDVASANVGEDVPAQVRSEIILDVSRLHAAVRQEWDSLRPDDVVFLAAVYPSGDGQRLVSNGERAVDGLQKLGLRHLRAAEVIHVQDDNGRPLRDSTNQANGHSYRVRQRRILVKLDSVAYKDDMDRVARGKANPYEAINVIIRRRGRENNFKPILDSIKRLTLSDVPAPDWLQDVFLGYGDPAGATYRRLPSRLKAVDYRDTFLDWQHLVEALPGRVIEPHEDSEGSFNPPYVLEVQDRPIEEPTPKHSKKRRRDQSQPPRESLETVKVSTYQTLSSGPYPTDHPKLNRVRFTGAQVEAITSGTQPGLTIIVGPPGTGKTDVATQIISNIYHDFPTQRTLLVAHSNQALNQLFQKIVALDIDERHLLRLGHGEDGLETEASYSKHGRVESFLENGARYLGEVQRLAHSLGAPGDHGNSCETADYFNSVYVKPAWARYSDTLQSADSEVQQIVGEFPFHHFFADAPQPLFPQEATKEDAVSIAAGCYRHVEKIFAELEDIRPFEILRNARDKANYLLIKEARIIAMTSTHAAMRRQEIASLGFQYDNVIMEEAAQITEVETFIPLALQKPKDGNMPLQRIVLCGDHLQNSPIIENLAFRQYANLDQSLFLRLVRLGVPIVMLDQQGRARPSLAELYKWRYPSLGNLPIVETALEFRTANAGLAYDYQFIDVPDYKGKGETEPSPHFIQNLGEAEYVVAMYMYMRLLGYPASKISILATYAGQRALIRDVLDHRCKGNRLFGLPRTVSTVDKYQGEQNDFVLLSLVRTARVGYLRDVRRLTVALSRARLGLYIFGRKATFEASYELKEAFEKPFQRPTKLALVTGELFPAERLLDDKVDGARLAEMEGVEHLGQYVFEMTQAKVKSLKEGSEVLPPQEPTAGAMDTDDEEEAVQPIAEDDAGSHGEDE